MKISFALANKLASFKNQKQAFETGTEYTLTFAGDEASDDTVITIDESREITVGDLLNLFTSIEKDGEFMKKGVRPVTLGQHLAEEAKKADANAESFDLPQKIKVTDRVNVGTTKENVEKLDNATTLLKGYKLHGIDLKAARIPQLWATSRKDAKYDKKEDFKVRTKIVVEPVS
jgi:hypothetical protein